MKFDFLVDEICYIVWVVKDVDYGDILCFEVGEMVDQCFLGVGIEGGCGFIEQ